jgi:hypothetical protein
MHLQIIHKYGSFFTKNIMQKKCPRLIETCKCKIVSKCLLKMQKFKVASDVFNLQIILPQSNPNVL